MSKQLNKSQRDKLAGYEDFFRSIEQKYGVTRENIMNVVLEQGLIKARIEAYFLVNSHLQKKNPKGIATDDDKSPDR